MANLRPDRTRSPIEAAEKDLFIGRVRLRDPYPNVLVRVQVNLRSLAVRHAGYTRKLVETEGNVEILSRTRHQPTDRIHVKAHTPAHTAMPRP